MARDYPLLPLLWCSSGVILMHEGTRWAWPPGLLSLVLSPFLSTGFFLQTLCLSFWAPNGLCNSPYLLPSTKPKTHSLFLSGLSPGFSESLSPGSQGAQSHSAHPLPPRLGLRRAAGTCCSSASHIRTEPQFPHLARSCCVRGQDGVREEAPPARCTGLTLAAAGPPRGPQDSRSS